MPRRALRADLPRITRALVDGFRDDPYFRWLYPDDSTYDDLATAWFGFVAGRLFERGHCYLEGEGESSSGAAIWVPPDVPVASPDDVAALVALLRSQIPERAEDAVSVIAASGQNEPEDAGPHFQLIYIAVDLSMRGSGAGSRMVAPVLDECDRDGLGVYVNSTNPRNLGFYERLGFRVIGETRVAGAPPIRAMWRDPQRR